MIDRSVFPFVEIGEVVTLSQPGGMSCDAVVVDMSDQYVTVETGEVFGKIRFTFLKGSFQAAMGFSPEDSPIITEYPEDRKDAIRLMDRTVNVLESGAGSVPMTWAVVSIQAAKEYLQGKRNPPTFIPPIPGDGTAKDARSQDTPSDN